MNLIVCCTPLQVLIAEKIIALYPKDDFFGVVFDCMDNSKYRYYFNRLKQCCNENKYILIPQEYHRFLPGKLRKICYFYRIRVGKILNLPIKKFDKIFISSIDSVFLQIMLSGINFDTVLTFDDGLINILPDSDFYRPDAMRSRRCWPCKNKYSFCQLRDLSCKHYSIYPDYQNVVSPVEIIDLMPKITQPIIFNKFKVVTKEPVRILLGQPLLEPDKCKKMAQQIMEHWRIKNYFPHPRESYMLDQVNIIKTNLIFEDYILNELSENPHTQYEIYSVGSSAILNVKYLPNVTVKFIQIIGIEQQVLWYQNLIDLFSEMKIEKLPFIPAFD